MRTTRLVAVSAMIALLLVPVGTAARQPHKDATVAPAAAFTATVTTKAYTKALGISVKVGATSVPSGKTVTGYFLSESPTANPVGSTPGWKKAPTTFPLGNTDGSHTVYVWARTSNAVSARGQAVTVVDRTAPTVSLFDVTPTTTATLTVPVTFTSADAASPIASGISSYAVVNGSTVPGSSSALWKSVAPTTVKLTVGNGLKTVTAFVRDRAGNVSLGGTDTVTLNIPGPTLTITMPAYTKTLSVAVNLDANDGASVGIKGYIVKESNTTPLVSANWLSKPSSITLSAGVGTKTVYAWVKDNNNTISPVASTTTVFDNIAPTASLTINTVAPATAWSISVTATGNALGGSPIAKYAVVNGTVAPTLASDWKDVAPTTMLLKKPNGTKTVSLFVKDAAGNVSAANTKTIVMTIPAPTLTLNIVPLAANETKVAIAVDTTKAAGTAIAGYFLSDTNVTPAASNPNWKLVTSFFTVSSGDGVKTVYGWVKDNNDSVSAVSSDTVRLDTTVPVATLTVTNNNTVNLALTVSATDTSGSGVTGYAIQLGTTPPDLNDGATWYANAVDVPLPGLTTNVATVVTAWAKDAAGNISASVVNTSTKTVTKQ